jgi:hypothetical protein
MKTKNKIPHLILAGLFGISTAHAATIAFGDDIYVDFGVNTSTIVNANTITDGVRTIADTTRSSGGNTGVGIALTRSANEGATYTNIGSLAGNALNTADPLAYGDALGIVNGSDDMIITFTGLNSFLTYDLTGGMSSSTARYSTGWTIENQAAATYLLSDATTTAGYVSFTGLTAVGTTTSDGTLTITLDRAVGISDKYHMGVSQLQLTAVPEPSSAALLGLGGFALILRRKRS